MGITLIQNPDVTQLSLSYQTRASVYINLLLLLNICRIKSMACEMGGELTKPLTERLRIRRLRVRILPGAPIYT